MVYFRKTFWAIFLLVFSLVADASNESQKLFICVKGVVSSFQLSEKPVITFDAKRVYVSTSDFYTTYDNVDSLFFQEKPVATSIEKVVEQLKPKFDFSFTDGHTVVISGFTQTVHLGVYSINGMNVNAETESTADGIIINLSNVPNGIYIIRINSQSFKINKR